jgi:type IV pilus assembly protein PilA
MKTNFKNEQGFTLVELMVVVAIIGILSAVAIPNFQKYQAKSKTSEAKLQLTSAYTAQEAFYADYGMYSNCLAYMGYDPSNEAAQRYYAVGINVTAAVDATPYADATSAGLTGSGDCAQAMASADGDTFFVAGKGVGGVLINTAALVGTAFGTGNTTCTEANVDAAGANGVACIGTQVTGNQAFKIVAAGIISNDGNTAATSSKFTISSNKIISNFRTGY